MLTIVQRGGATREKPSEAVRGFASRLPWAWDGLCLAVPFNDPTQDSARDLIWGAPPSQASGLVWTRDARGNAALNLGSSSYIRYPDNPAHNKPSDAITTYVRARNAGAAEVSSGVFSKRYGDNSPWASWAIVSQDASGQLRGHLAVDAGVYYWDTAYNLSTTEYSSVFMRWQSGGELTLDVFGERGNTLLSSHSGLFPTGHVPYASGEPLSINATEVITNNSNNDYSQCMLWSRRLSDTELQALVADPFGWYSPRRETVGVGSPYPIGFGSGEMRHGNIMGGLR
jgi:hypothetical protein